MSASEAFTSETAKQFDRISVGNSALLMSVLECSCEPYRDVFTYRRWAAQGFQVQRGQRAIKLPLIRNVPAKDKVAGEVVGSRRLMTRSAVFCRCQVKPAE